MQNVHKFGNVRVIFKLHLYYLTVGMNFTTFREIVLNNYVLSSKYLFNDEHQLLPLHHIYAKFYSQAEIKF